MPESDKTRLVHRRSLVEDYPELIDSQYIPVLNAVIWVVLIGSAVLAALLGAVLEKEYQWRMYIPAALAVLALAAHLFLRYRGVVSALRLLALGGWVLATAGGIATEGVRTPILLAYPMLVIFSGWTLGARYGVGLFIASSVAIVAMAVAQSMGIIGRAAPFAPAIMALAYLLVLSISIAMTLYLLRSFHQSYARYRLLTENIKDVVWILDIESLHYRYVSPSVERLCGYTPEELLAVPVTHTLAGDAGEQMTDRIRRRMQDAILDKAHPHKYYTDEIEQTCKDGSTVWTEVISSHYLNPENGRMELRGVTRDISERKRMDIELQQMATTDFLTGIPNRRHFMAQLDLELARLQRLEARGAAVLMLDLDHFKGVNDRFGHATGDMMLKHFTALVRRELRRIDTVGRVGGEEFGIILPGADRSGAKVFAERLRLKVAQTPLVQEGQAIPMTVSIGIAALSGADAAAVLARADGALYRAKAAGRDRVEVAGDAPPGEAASGQPDRHSAPTRALSPIEHPGHPET